MRHCPQIQNYGHKDIMLADYEFNLEESNNISYSVTLVPRLEYSVTILDDIIKILKKKTIDLKKFNDELIDEDGSEKIIFHAVEHERTVLYSLEILKKIRQIIKKISGIHSIPENLSSTVSMSRIASANLYQFLPSCSHKLSELSLHLGSIVLDSAILTKASFNFGESNKESAELLDELNLIVDSKINKQYPNVDFS